MIVSREWLLSLLRFHTRGSRYTDAGLVSRRKFDPNHYTGYHAAFARSPIFDRQKLDIIEAARFPELGWWLDRD